MVNLPQQSLQSLNLPANKQQGLSLIEIMVAMLISLFLLGGVIQVYSSTSTTYADQRRAYRVYRKTPALFLAALL